MNKYFMTRLIILGTTSNEKESDRNGFSEIFSHDENFKNIARIRYGIMSKDRYGIMSIGK